MTDFDVIITGAGPAGSSLAAFLGKKERKVLLADKFYFPVDKVCGECISPGALSTLEKIGIKDKLDSIHTEKVLGVSFYSPDNSKKTIQYPGNNFGYAVSRRELDKIILDKACEYTSVTSIEGLMIKGVLFEKNQVIIKASKNKKEFTFSAKLLVAADGRYSTIAKLLKNYSITSEFKRYVYVATLENVRELTNNIELVIKSKKLQYLISKQGNNLASIAVVINEKNYNKKGMNKESYIELLKLSDIVSKKLGNIRFETKLKGIILQKYHLKSLVSDRVIYIGDTTGFIDPITGEGMYRAFKSSELASEVINKALEQNSFQKKDLFEYQESMQKEFSPVYKFIKTAVFLTSNEYVSNFILKRMREDSNFAKKLVGLQGAIIPGKELFSVDTVKLCLQLMKES